MKAPSLRRTLLSFRGGQKRNSNRDYGDDQGVERTRSEEPRVNGAGIGGEMDELIVAACPGESYGGNTRSELYRADWGKGVTVRLA
jgi:hypothetical protein